MNEKFTNPKKLIPVVWIILLCVVYFGKMQNIIERGHISYFVAEYVIWFFVGSFFTSILYLYFEKNTEINFLKSLMVIIIFSFLITITLWLLLYFPLTYLWDSSLWFESFTVSVVMMTFYTSGFILLFWLLFYKNFVTVKKSNKLFQEKLILEANLREAQLNSLKGQINPHFMFNTLNNIRGLMREDVERSRRMLTSLSENLRYSLTKSNADSIALEDELEVVENYIDLAKIQYEDRLQFDTDIDQKTLLINIPPMIIQMLVENSIKHGIAKLKNGGFVKLSSKINAGLLEIKVVNSGSISYSENSTELGLENIKKRLKLLYNDKATFSLNESENTVVATIQIPMP